MFCPGTIVAGPFLTTCISACGVTVSVSVAVLLPGSISATPAGAVIVAVFTTLTTVEGDMLATTRYVALPPASSETGVAARLPTPLATQVEPAEAVHVQVAEVIAAGSVSVTVALATSLGPAFDATTCRSSTCPARHSRPRPSS